MLAVDANTSSARQNVLVSLIKVGCFYIMGFIN